MGLERCGVRGLWGSGGDGELRGFQGMKGFEPRNRGQN